MPKETTGKNSKNTKKTVANSTISKKANNTKTSTKKSTVVKKSTPDVKKEVKVIEKEVAKKGEAKEIVKETAIEKKKGREIKTLSDKVLCNTPFAISLCIILLLVAILIFVLCIKRIPKNSKGDEIVATIKGKEITANELYESLKDDNGTNSLIKIIDSYIVEKEVTVTKEDKEYVQSVVDYYKDYADYYQVDLATLLANYVGLTGISTEDEFYNFVMEDYKKTLAVKKFIGDNAKEEDLKAYYKENFSDKITAKHILIQVDSEAEDADAADEEAYSTAVKLIQTLNKTDKENLTTKFDELAKNNSDDTATYSNGGLIEDFEKASVEKEFWDAASALKDGEYTSEPIKTTYGYHIILKVSSTPVEKYKDIIDEVKSKYAENLLSKDSTLNVTEWDKLRKQYKMSIIDDEIKSIYEKTIKDSKGSTDTSTDEAKESTDTNTGK